MHVFILENNLMWSSRLSRSAKALGHDVTCHDRWSGPPSEESVAILNLGSPELCTPDIVAELHAAGCKTIGHAGHKEQPLIQHGESMGVHLVVSNSMLTHKLAEVLERISAQT